MFLNHLLILRDVRSTAVRRPVRRGLVVERHVDVRVVLDLFELVRSLVRNEDEVDLRRRKCCMPVESMFITSHPTV